MLSTTGKLKKPLIEYSLTSTMCALAAEGVGLALVDPFAANDFRSENIVCRPFQPALPYTVSIAYPANKQPSYLAEEFTRLLSEAVDTDFR